MKKLLKSFMVFVAVLFAGMGICSAASLPKTFVTDPIREVEYIKNFPVIVKSANNKQYYVYCMNMSATYAGGITYTKTAVVDEGFVYIMQNRPKTSNKDKDFYITQMAVWYYDDYLNNNNFNLVEEVKKYIIAHSETEDVSKAIYKLYDGAKKYKQEKGTITLGRDNVTFSKIDNYFVSSEISLSTKNVSGIKYSLENAPQGTLIVKKDNGNLVVKVPIEKVSEGKEIKITLKVSGDYTKKVAYYYYYTSSYQKILFPNLEDKKYSVNDQIAMVVSHYPEEKEVKISKTDVTETKEVPGATLVIKDEKGNVVDSWISTTTPHTIKLKTGLYSLTETIAPDGYKLSKSTVEFKVESNGTVSVKKNGAYISVSKVNMINELKDSISIKKLDKDTLEYVTGATLVVKNEQGSVIKEFTTEGKVNSFVLDPGYYTLSEKQAPVGYVLNTDVIYFYFSDKGELKVKNDKGEYVLSDSVTIYNKRQENGVIISKTDITETKEIPGATLVLKDESGNVLDTWVSEATPHVVKLKAGKYSLTETIAPVGYKLSTTAVEFMVDNKGIVYTKKNDTYVSSAKVNMINELKDTVSIKKLDKNTLQYVSGATLVLKDNTGSVISEFVTEGKANVFTLDAGKYSLSEKQAPVGYLLTNEVIYFELSKDGTLRIKNEKGEYKDADSVVIYNKKENEEEVPVPPTDKNSTLLIISGITLLIGGALYAKKTIKEC